MPYARPQLSLPGRSRLPTALLALPVIGVVLTVYGGPWKRGWRSVSLIDLGNASQWQAAAFWVVWACLAGVFLAGMVMVFRVDGNRLQRRATAP